MLDFRSAVFDYEPYPVGLIRPVFEEELYKRLVASYPPLELFEFKKILGDKYSLSEVNNAAKYRDFIAANPDWKAFHSYIKGPDFIPSVLEFLISKNVDLGIRRYAVVSQKKQASYASPLSLLMRRAELSARFEFAAMGADGGHILPHTDASQKLVTLVFSMITADDWQPNWGGGTDVVMPVDRSRIYNHINAYLALEDVEVLRTFEFEPNQCLVFVKTFNSWHSVSPMRGPPTDVRRTLTINIEAKR